MSDTLFTIVGNGRGTPCEICGLVPPAFHGTVYKSSFCLRCFPLVDPAIKRARLIRFRRDLKRRIEKTGWVFEWCEEVGPNAYRVHKRRRSERHPEKK